MKRGRLYLKPTGKQHFVVRIYPTRQLMIAAIRRENVQVGFARDYSTDCHALCRTYLKFTLLNGTKTTKRSPHLGDLFFYEGSLTPDVIAHEIAHAVIEWFDRKRTRDIWPARGRRNEEFAETLGYLVGQMYANVVKHGTVVRGTRLHLRPIPVRTTIKLWS